MKLEDCAKKNGVNLIVWHVLRYTKFFEKLKSLVEEKENRYRRV